MPALRNLTLQYMRTQVFTGATGSMIYVNTSNDRSVSLSFSIMNIVGLSFIPVFLICTLQIIDWFCIVTYMLKLFFSLCSGRFDDEWRPRFH
jgi:hypothetical protein